MSIKELKAYKDGHEETMLKMLNIMSKYLVNFPDGMLKEIEDYTKGKIYELDECLGNQ